MIHSRQTSRQRAGRPVGQLTLNGCQHKICFYSTVKPIFTVTCQ